MNKRLRGFLRFPWWAVPGVAWGTYDITVHYFGIWNTLAVCMFGGGAVISSILSIRHKKQNTKPRPGSKNKEKKP